MASDNQSEALAQLAAHFINRDPNDQSSGWVELWNTERTHVWDRGGPSPALIDWIESNPDLLPRPTGDRRLKALVPGCGKGYDVAMLALHGFDVYGLDVSPKGLETADAYTKAELREPLPHNFASDDTNRPSGDAIGTVKFLNGDFFKKDWEKDVSTGEFQGFDLIYDYTFLCALAPEMRKGWEQRMSELLSPTGVLACLEFPLFKNLKAQGPPWGLKGVYWNILAKGDDGIIDEDSAGEIGPLEGRFERALYIKPPRSYESGQGTDMFSVWRLKR
ncbi:S-adenosyl-L-methionine-dependent methyltransferase [Hypoxylon sp. NC1633]|nr:S-adenosyl-L-methionine-dependent methyltransferase [Hypoxylon sp. NC1633]